MKKIILPIIFLLTLQISSFAQTETMFHSTFELQTGIGLVNLIGSKGGILDEDNLGFYSKSITDINHLGGMVQLGAISSRQLSKNFWIRSGLQIMYSQAKAEYLIQENYNDGITSWMTNEDREVKIKSYGLQVPILFEYRYDFEKWGLYSNSGLTFSYSYPKIQTRTVFSASERVEQYGVAGTFGLGMILNQTNKYSWRFGYQLSIDLVPFNQSNNTREKIYHPKNERDRDYRHLVHQLNFSFVWPEREIILDKTTKDQRWIGWFLGTSLSTQIPLSNKRRSGRSGVGWGRNLQLKWIASSGFGLHLQHGIWIAPASSYATKIKMTQANFLYQLPHGLEFTTGINFRNEIDVDGGGGSYLGLLLGTGRMIPLLPHFGIQLNLSGYYVPNYYGEKILIEAGIGIIYNLLNR